MVVVACMVVPTHLVNCMHGAIVWFYVWWLVVCVDLCYLDHWIAAWMVTWLMNWVGRLFAWWFV